MIKINPKKTSKKILQEYLLSVVGPRPIALASTIDKNNIPNLSPFSFFNVFSGNPPILIFSPAKRIRDNTEKDTLRNVKQTSEVVINIVTENIVEQMVLSSLDYPSNVDEFLKSGLTHLNSELVSPFRVKESPVQIECKINDIIPLGKEGGAGNLIICEVLLIHISEEILDENKKVNQEKINLIGRLGFNWYIKSSSHSIFQIAKKKEPIMEINDLPKNIANSYILSKNDLVRLLSIKIMPTKAEINELSKTEQILNIFNENDDNEMGENLQKIAKEHIECGNIYTAWKYLLIDKKNK